MKMAKSYLIPSILLISSLVLLNQGMNIKKDATLEAGKITLEEAKVTSTEAKTADIITAKQLIDSLALKAKLPIETSIEKNAITVKPIKDIDENNKGTILTKYTEMMDFATSISSLPYKMEYVEYCIGSECENGFIMKINVLGV